MMAMENAINNSGNAVMTVFNEAFSAVGFMDPLLLPQLSFQVKTIQIHTIFTSFFTFLTVDLAFFCHCLCKTVLVNASFLLLLSAIQSVVITLHILL